MSDNLVVVCVHVLKGEQVFHQTDGHLLCEKCFRHYNNYGHDKEGYWKIPKNEDFTNLKSICSLCVNQIINSKHYNMSNKQ